MSEQSGPITREQVERAIDAAYDCNAQGVNAALGAFWYEREDIPADVRDGWRQVGYLGLRIALTRWHAELAAAEPARRVARWDAELEAYALTPIHDDGALMTHAVEDAAKARDWGYEIEGGPEPVRDWKSDRAIAAIWPTPKPAEDSPERLRERREALGWTTAYAGHWVAWFDHTDVERAECGRGVPAFVARYAAALSAEEARRAAVGAWAAGGGVLHYSPPTEPERPAPRFKVGDWVRVTALGAAHHGHTYQIAEIYGSWHRKVRGDLDCSYMARNLEPASPPAPEVVDVPQPRIVVKRCDEVEAEWTSADATILIVTHDALDDAIFVPIALLRAMLAAIDAQQGGAS